LPAINAPIVPFCGATDTPVALDKQLEKLAVPQSLPFFSRVYTAAATLSRAWGV